MRSSRQAKRSRPVLQPLSGQNHFGMTRRRFAQLLGAAGTLGLVEPHILAGVFSEPKKRLSWLAFRTAGAEGAWSLTKIEGKVPRELNGTLYRVAPGQKDNHGTLLRHLFDGDAFTSAYSFRDGKVFFRAKFVDTPERQEEVKAGKMLYSEFGTQPPPTPEAPAGRRGKNQPNVNIIHWDGRLLGLSEGGHPTAIDPKTLAFQSRWDYQGTLPANVPYTAHPKFDPATGEGYGFGVAQGPSMALTVFRMNRDGKLTQLYAVPLGGYYMVHDMLMSKDHLVFVVPPVKYNLGQMMSGKGTVADAVKFFDKEPTRLLVLRKDGSAKPVIINEPAGMVFHHGNAFEKDGKVVMDSCMAPDGTVLDALYSWDKDRLPKATDANLTHFVIDPVKGTVESRTEMQAAQELPRFDSRLGGKEARYLYALETIGKDEFGLFSALSRHDLQKNTAKRVAAGKGRMFGEPVFVPHPGTESEDRGWILIQGYDGGRDQTFLEVRDAATLDWQARIWTGNHFPLGFHGNYYPELFIDM